MTQAELNLTGLSSQKIVEANLSTPRMVVSSQIICLPNITKTSGKSMVMIIYVDSDHAGDTVTRRSITRFLSSSIMHQYIRSQRSKIVRDHFV